MVGVRALFTEVFEHDIAPEAEADERDVLVTLSDGVIDHMGKIIADARVISAEDAVWLTRAATVVPSKRIPVTLLEGE